MNITTILCVYFLFSRSAFLIHQVHDPFLNSQPYILWLVRKWQIFIAQARISKIILCRMWVAWQACAIALSTDCPVHAMAISTESECLLSGFDPYHAHWPLCPCNINLHSGWVPSARNGSCSCLLTAPFMQWQFWQNVSVLPGLGACQLLHSCSHNLHRLWVPSARIVFCPCWLTTPFMWSHSSQGVSAFCQDCFLSMLIDYSIHVITFISKMS